MDIYASIWEDIYLTGTEDSYDYSVMCDGEVIYVGRAYLKPNSVSFAVNISKICQDYLSNEIDDFRDITEQQTLVHSDAYKEFQVYHDDEIVNTYHLLYCWDYRTRMRDSSLALSNPINRKYCDGMKLFFTVFDWTNQRVATTVKTGGGLGYDVESCGKGALYYKSRSGGWCSFLIEGGCVRTDNYDRYTINHPFDNGTMQFEEGVYHNEISTEWTLTTGWLTDEQSKRLAYNLIPSSTVYFHNFEDDTIVPVVMTDTSVKYKTYRNNSKRLVNYEIKIRESQKKQNL